MKKIIALFIAVLATGCVTTTGSGGGTGAGNGLGNQQGNQTASCSAANCAGCCTGGVCFAGTTNGSCGVGGKVCGACYSPDVCFTDGMCGLDPSAQWIVQPVSAKIASSNNGSAWDGDGSAPDVVLTTTCPGGSYGVTLQEESYNPDWVQSGNCTATAQDLLTKDLTFSLIDSDVAFDDTITGNVTYGVTTADLRAGGVSLGAVQGINGITYTFTLK